LARPKILVGYANGLESILSEQISLKLILNRKYKSNRIFNNSSINLRASL